MYGGTRKSSLARRNNQIQKGALFFLLFSIPLFWNKRRSTKERKAIIFPQPFQTQLFLSSIKEFNSDAYTKVRIRKESDSTEQNSLQKFRRICFEIFTKTRVSYLG